MKEPGKEKVINLGKVISIYLNSWLHCILYLDWFIIFPMDFIFHYHSSCFFNSVFSTWHSSPLKDKGYNFYNLELFLIKGYQDLIKKGKPNTILNNNCGLILWILAALLFIGMFFMIFWSAIFVKNKKNKL